MAFKTLEFWVDMYDTVAQRKVASRIGKIPADRKIAFNRPVATLKRHYGFDDDDIKTLIYFMYTHNPLSKDDLREYGKIFNLERSAPHYLYWKNQNKQLVRELGLMEAVKKTVPKWGEIDKYLTSLADELVNAYND